MGKRKLEGKPKSEGEFDLGFKHLKSIHSQTNQKRLIVILSGAQLETVKVSEIMNYLIHAFLHLFLFHVFSKI